MQMQHSYRGSGGAGSEWERDGKKKSERISAGVCVHVCVRNDGITESSSANLPEENCEFVPGRGLCT